MMFMLRTGEMTCMGDRTAFMKDYELSQVGFPTLEEARAVADKLGPPDTETQRIRVRYRSRTNCWDVLVKKIQVVKS